MFIPPLHYINQSAITMNYYLKEQKEKKNVPMPQESMAHEGDFLIASQSDFANSIGLYCDPTSHAYC